VYWFIKILCWCKPNAKKFPIDISLYVMLVLMVLIIVGTIVTLGVWESKDQ
jgi:hypothetical protein